MRYYDIEDTRLAEEAEVDYMVTIQHHLCTIIGEQATAKLYDAFGDSNAILDASYDAYRKSGLTINQAKVMHAAKSLRYVPMAMSQIRCSKDTFDHVKHIANESVEHFIVVVLNRANRVLKVINLAVGGLSGVVVDTKILFRKVIDIAKANGIILCHNHPSANLSPSESDLTLTKKVVECGRLLDIKVLDHLIVSGETYLSFADEGYL